MMKRKLSMLLVLCILLTSIPVAAQAAGTNQVDWLYASGSASLAVYQYNKAESGEPIAVDCASVAAGEPVYYAIKLTIPANVLQFWYEAMAEQGVKVAYGSVAKDAALKQAMPAAEYFCLPAWTDAKDGTEWYLANTATGSASATGSVNTAMWVPAANFSTDTCVWEKYAMADNPSISVECRSDSGHRDEYYAAYYKISLNRSGESLVGLTFEDHRTGGDTIKLHLASGSKLEKAEIDYNGKSYIINGYSNNDRTAFMAEVNSVGETLSCNTRPGSSLKELFDTFGLTFGAVISEQAAYESFGWDVRMTARYMSKARESTPKPELNPDYCYTSSPMLTISNYDKLSGAMYKLYRKENETYVYDDSLTKAVKFNSAYTFYLSADAIAAGSYPLELAISATISGCKESELAAFEMRKPQGKDEDITEALPSGGEGAGGGGATAAPAAVWIHGPVTREDQDVPPEVEITKYDDLKDLPEYEDMRGYINNNKQNYAYYKIELKNAAVKEDSEMEIRFYFGRENANKKVWVLHLCSKHDKIEKHEGLKINKDGFVSIMVHAFSPFVVGFEDPDTTTGKSSGVDIRYEGGNRFATSRSDKPKSVEIDGIPVSFTGTGSSFIVNSIPAGAKWITVKWQGATATVSFVPDNSVVNWSVALPKTGEASIMARIFMATAAMWETINK